MVKDPSQTSQSNQELPWTGERFVTSLTGDIYFEHIHRYAFASEFCKDKTCLDIASGEGFGSNLLAMKASYVWGVDIDEQSVVHAKRKYARENLEFVTGSATSIPLKDKSVDVVASFETIEHFTDHDKFMQEVVRVLKVGGLFVISSPDKEEYTDKTGSSNPFHQAELYHRDFYKLLKTYFARVLIGKQRLIMGSCITPDCNVAVGSTRFGFFSGGVSGTQFVEALPAGLYSIAVCSNGDIPEVKYGIFEDPTVHVDAQGASLRAEVEYLDRVVQSARRWQKRSWIKRAFHRWRPPDRRRPDLD